jgi:hypothetical protein
MCKIHALAILRGEVSRALVKAIARNQHSRDAQFAPVGATSKLVRNATPEVHKGAPHGMCTTLKDQDKAGLLDFVK